MKEHAKVSTVVNKSYIRTPKPDEQIKVEPSVAMVKDLLEENVDGHVIYFYEEAARIAKPGKKDKHRPVVGMPVVSVKIGDHYYHGLCDISASMSGYSPLVLGLIRDKGRLLRSQVNLSI